MIQTAKKQVLRLFNKGCTDFRLLEEDDHILVALSGGKDSLELVRLLGARAKIFRPRITVEAAHVVMENIPYETDTEYLRKFCAESGVKLHILKSRFDETGDPRKTRCFLCARSRRRTLFDFAVSQGFNKVALGHHNDDILTTFLMNLTFEGSASSMPPKLALKHYPLQLIRPLCLVHECDISTIAEAEGFHRQKKPCPYEEVTRRATMNALFHQLQTINPEARYSLWHAFLKAASQNK